MFRINQIFENELTTIFKIEGEISDGNLHDWTDAINRLIKLPEKQIILEICEVTLMSPKAVQVLIDVITGNVYLLNGPTFVKNILKSAGLSGNVLD